MKVLISDIRLQIYRIPDDRYEEIKKSSINEIADVCFEEGLLEHEVITGYADDPIKFYADDDIELNKEITP